MSEHSEQVTLVKWAKLRANQDQRLKMLFSIPNGGDRDVRVGAKLKAEGVRRGVPDLCLPVPCGVYHGLWIELKTATGRVTDYQRWWHDQLAGYGYMVEVCRSCADAIRAIEEYLDCGN